VTATTAETVRADAARNRRRLLAAALRAFSSGDEATVTLEAIARQAGVGIGTLMDGLRARTGNGSCGASPAAPPATR
jgi:hypothetical protein